MKKQKRSILVSVTESDIASGVSGSLGHCPIALAVGRQFPGHLVMVTGDGEITIPFSGINFLKGDYQRLTQPFIKKFDSSSDVEPFGFTIEMR
jgi:hypothetical protein